MKWKALVYDPFKSELKIAIIHICIGKIAISIKNDSIQRIYF